MVEHKVAEELKGTGWGMLWWSLAALLHVGAVCAIVYFTPLREWFLGREEPEQSFASLEGDRMRRIAQAMIEVNTRRVAKKVEEQLEVLAELQRIRDKRYERMAGQLGLAKQRGSETPEITPISALGAPGPDTSRYTNPYLAREDPTGLYAIAQKIEETTFGTYRQMRAIELARIQMLPLLEALEATKVAIPNHPDVDGLVFEQDVWNARDGRLEALKQELFKVYAEVSGMVASGLRMLDMANDLMAEDVGRTIVFGQGGSMTPGGSGLWGSDVGPSLAPHEYFPGGSSGNFDESFRPTAGRKLMDDGIEAEWMYLDTWYIIGPFPNPNRQFIDKKFPPESAIDLDATYVGKDGLKLKWQFRQSHRLMVAPHLATNYAIWYAYTEIYSDRDQERWVIFGSDDYSRAWLNGEKVWSSGTTPHHWIPDRGYRKLKFKRGYNPLLLKLENAGGTTGYSVAVFLGDMSG